MCRGERALAQLSKVLEESLDADSAAGVFEEDGEQWSGGVLER